MEAQTIGVSVRGHRDNRGNSVTLIRLPCNTVGESGLTRVRESVRVRGRERVRES